jgi:hypothetical protein
MQENHAADHLISASIETDRRTREALLHKEVITDWPLKLVLDRRPFI